MVLWISLVSIDISFLSSQIVLIWSISPCLSVNLTKGLLIFLFSQWTNFLFHWFFLLFSPVYILLTSSWVWVFLVIYFFFWCDFSFLLTIKLKCVIPIYWYDKSSFCKCRSLLLFMNVTLNLMRTLLEMNT